MKYLKGSFRKIVVISLLFVGVFFWTTPGFTAPVTLRFYWYEPRFLDIMNGYIAQFEKENPDIKIELEIVPWDAYWQKLPVSIAAGTAPDIFFLVSGQVQNYASMGGLLDLTQYIPRKDLKNFRDVQLAFCTYNKQVIALPFTCTTLTLFYNMDHFKRAGVTPPQSLANVWRWDTFEANITKVMTANQLIYGMLNGGREFWWLPWFYSNGAELFDKDYTKCTINSPQGLETLKFLADLTKKKVIAPPPETNLQLFLQGKVALHSAGHWDVKEITEGVGKKFKFGATFFPKGKTIAVALGGDYLGIYNKTKYPKEAVKFLSFLTSSKVLLDYSNRFNYLPPIKASPKYDIRPDIMRVANLQASTASTKLTLDRGIPKYGNISPIVNAEYTLSMLGQKSLEEALRSMEEQINRILSEK